MVRETKDLLTFKCRRALTIATYSLPATLEFLHEKLFSERSRSKCFCKLINNKMNFQWAKSVSCQTSSLQWLQPEVGYNTDQSPCKCRKKLSRNSDWSVVKSSYVLCMSLRIYYVKEKARLVLWTHFLMWLLR